MDFEQVIAAVSATLQTRCDRSLSDLEVVLLRGAWDELTYDEIAAASGYSLNYLQRDFGPRFWRLLSEVYGRKLNKINARAVLTQKALKWGSEGVEGEGVGSPEAPTPLDSNIQNSITPSPLTPLPSTPYPLPITPSSLSTAPLAPSHPPDYPPVYPQTHASWGEAPDVSTFYGRAEELAILGQWLVGDQCRLVAILGMGGIGKSSLAARLAEGTIGSFECMIWRSLRNAPPLETLLGELVPFVSQQQDVQPTLDRLMYWLLRRRCLLILDNVETVMQAGDRVGIYQAGYEGYGDLLLRLGETMHQSCAVLTSREKPAEIALLEEPKGKVRSLTLMGSRTAALALLEARGLVGSDDDKHRLGECYGWSPLALKIVAASIQTLFEGSIPAFLAAETLVYNGIRRLLDQQFERLSELEQTIMTWLAVNREWTDLTTLQQDLVPPVSGAELLEALESLVWRSLVEQHQRRYTQQPVVMEYVTRRLIDQVVNELSQGQWGLCDRVALVKTTLQDYLRHSQERLILGPVLTQLAAAALLPPDRLPAYLQTLLTQLQRQPTDGYSAGNLFNLLTHHRSQWVDLDLSGLTLRHVNLQKLTLHRVSFARCRFVHPVFTQTISAIFAVAFSPTSGAFGTEVGSLMALGESSGNIHLWRTDGTQPLLTLRGHNNRVLSVTFGPTGRLLASASADGTVNLWELPSGRRLASLRGHSNGVCSVSFSADGTRLASASMDGTIRVWNVQTHQCDRILTGHDGWVWAVAFAPQGHTLASGSADTTLKLWDTNTGALLNTLIGPSISEASPRSNRLCSVQFSPDGSRLASASEDHTVKLWDAATGALLHSFAGHTSIVWSVSFSADGSRLASGSSDRTVRVWDVASGDLLRTLIDHTGWVWSVHFSHGPVHLPTGSANLLLSGCTDCTAKLWDVDSGRLIKTIQGYTNGVRALAFDPSGTQLASGTTADPAINLWHGHTGKPIATLAGHTATVHALSCRTTVQGTDILASGGADRVVRLWNLTTGQLLHALGGHTDTIWAVGLTADARLCASAGANYTLRLWDVATGTLLHRIDEDEGRVWSLDFSPDGTLLAIGCDDSVVKLREVATGDVVRRLEGHSAWARSVKFSPDGQLLASGSADCTVKLWDVATGALLHTLGGHDSWIWEVSFSPPRYPNGPLTLASGSTDRSVKLWDVATGQLLRTLEGHSGEVWAVRFSPDGSLLASGSADATIRLWNPQTSDCLRVLWGDRPYEGMDITGAIGLTDAQQLTLKTLGAVTKT